ncbi:SDR family NAD(P)-dependent oxidoreductase [Micromonospora craniellae]|uniref:SDR family NAD(P)-dependent oxidoreductase n=1 Tax=Micromonospora craniellae TaxID=2294034 RepID=UPI0013149A9F|nr:SDR family oxidoreductase [Micromonospora craniellae]QOC91279.1 SDR family oxidoreductase [Micromonospora craniellae]
MSRRVLVTGAAGAIGGELVAAFLARGWRVAGLDRRPPEPSTTAGPARRRPEHPGAAALDTPPTAGLTWLSADVTDASAVEAAVDRLRADWGGLDVLVNNAAVGPPRAPVGRETAAHLRSVLEVNLVAPLALVQATLPLLTAGDAPAVVQLSSIGGSRAFRGNAAYVASKGGIEAMTRALALDLAGRGIRVNAVAPAMVRTPGWDDAGPNEVARRTGLVPLGRAGTLAEVAAAVSFLAGSESGYITGVVLPVDGGLGAQAYSPVEEPGVAATLDPSTGDD